MYIKQICASLSPNNTVSNLKRGWKVQNLLGILMQMLKKFLMGV